MAALGNEIGGLLEKLHSIFSTYNIVSDTLDVLLITAVIFFFIRLIRDSRAINFVKGLVIFAVCYILVTVFKMQASTFLFSKIFESFLIILVVIFAPEIRSVFEKLGRTGTFSGVLSFIAKPNTRNAEYNKNISTAVNELCRAVLNMSRERTGALIVFEKNTPLGEIIESGTVLDAEISSELVENIFYPKSPLHDGAAVVRGGRLAAAGCILPLTDKSNLSSAFGTRHRAAIGMTEQSDALVIVVSEETGKVSAVENGSLRTGISDGDMRECLLDFLRLPEDTKDSEPKKKASGREEDKNE